nr:MAG TPA: hypothetical protein [Caudoviricetes sp.]
MGRYKKTEISTENEAPQFVPPMETFDNEELNTQEEVKTSRIIPLIASEDVPLHKGGVLVPTVIKLTGCEGAIVVSTQDNAINGLLVEDNKRLTSSYVVPMLITTDNEANVVINVCDEVNVLRQTQYGTRMDNLIIPAGTHVADLVIV